MPPTKVVFFRDSDGSVPLLSWFDGLPPKVEDKCTAKLELLIALGYELRRPHAALLRDGICELRVRWGHVNYRMLYFFHGNAAVISHGLTKEDVVPDAEINRALNCKRKFERNPGAHTYGEQEHA